MSQPEDLREEYDAPFAIFTPEEGERYTHFVWRGFNQPRSIDLGLIKNPELRNPIEAHCRTLGFEKFVQMKFDAYDELTQEFYTTFNLSDGGDDDGPQFSCRLMGKNVTVTCQTLCDIFGFPPGGLKRVPKEFDRVGFWKQISDGRGDFKNGKASSALIKDPILFLMHRYISLVVFGKTDSANMASKDLLYLSSLCGGDRVSTPCFLIANFNYVVTNERANMCLGNIITAIALHFGVFDPLVDTGMRVMHPMALSINSINNVLKAPKEVPSSSCQADGEGTDPVVAIVDKPAVPKSTVDTGNLISWKVERMEIRIEDAMGFNGLKRKVYFPVDLRKDVSNGTETVEEMKMEILEANKTIEKLRLEKLESDKAAEKYKTWLEKCFLRIKKMEEGDAKSMKMRDLTYLVNDMPEHELCSFGKGDFWLHEVPLTYNSRNRWSSLVDDDVEDLALWSTLTSHSSKGVSEKAARDDETIPNGAVETSKRGPSSDETNRVQRIKRTKT